MRYYMVLPFLYNIYIVIHFCLNGYPFIHCKVRAMLLCPIQNIDLAPVPERTWNMYKDHGQKGGEGKEP